MKEKWINFFDRGAEWSLYCLIFSIPLFIAGIEIFFGIALFFFVFKKLMKPDFKFLKSTEHFFLLLFFVFCALSLINSGPYFHKSLHALISKWLEYILILLMIEDTMSKHERIWNVIIILFSVSFFIGIDGLSQYFLARELVYQKSLIWINQGFYAITATFYHYNNLGIYLGSILLLIIAFLGFGKFKKIYRLALLPLLVLLSTCLLLTFSRGSWIGFLAGLALMLFLTKRARIIIPILCVFAVVVFVIEPLRDRALFFLHEHGLSERLPLMNVGWNITMENPFLGKGIGTFMDYCSARSSGEIVKYAHNCFLQIWAETGIFALVSFILFVGTILYKGIKKFKKESDFIALGFTCAIFGFLVHSSLDTNLYSIQVAAFFWSLTGILLASIRMQVVT